MYAHTYYDLHNRILKGFILQSIISFKLSKKGLWYPISSSPIIFKRLLTLFRHRGQTHRRRVNELAWQNMLSLFKNEHRNSIR